MADRALQSMTVEDFLAWDDGTDTRYELVDGVPMAMNPPTADHGRIAHNAATAIDRAVADRRPCRAVTGAGVLISERPRGNVFIPDALMTCEPIDGRKLLDAPRLVVEILSPSTEGFDKTTKLAIYGRLPSLEEIWLVSSRRRAVLLYERRDATWHAGLPHIGRASFESRVLGRAVALDELYELTPLANANEDEF
jgi:Uma2 family endonuclease